MIRQCWCSVAPRSGRSCKNPLDREKVEEMENKYDPRGAWRAMREISSMFAGHIKSAVTMRTRKKDGTMATADEENRRVLCDHFDGVFNAPATAQDGIEEVIEQREIVSALGELPSEDEVDYAIARAATEKSPGVDGVPIEAFKIIQPGHGASAAFGRCHEECSLEARSSRHRFR